MKGEKIAVIGAGLVGSLQAVYLAKKGFQVELIESRPDMRKAELSAGRSINLALSDRGWKALEGVGIDKEIRKLAIPMKGRMMHDLDGNLTFQPYGKEGQAIYSVSRGGLNQRLLELADEFDNVNISFEMKCQDLNLETNTLTFDNRETGKEEQRTFDRIFGTDGAFSSVRQRLQKTDRFNFSQFYLTHGYKELTIPPAENGKHRIETEALHIWPRGEFMLIALPNLDGSFTCTLFFPFEGETSFESIKTEADVKKFFAETFPDAMELMPTLVEDYFENPTSSLVTIRCNPWYHEDKVLIMGDASHAIVPFYGQGMNSGFEDCTVFNDIFEDHSGDWEDTFSRFSEKRVPETNAIAELAFRNFIEMRDKTADKQFLLQKKIERKFSEKHPEKWLPLYSQVTFSHIPYDEALRAGDRQDAIMKKVMDRPDIEQVWDSEEVEAAILKELS
jgi:kynurenine 3-monooxygenase